MISLLSRTESKKYYIPWDAKVTCFATVSDFSFL